MDKKISVGLGAAAIALLKQTPGVGWAIDAGDAAYKAMKDLEKEEAIAEQLERLSPIPDQVAQLQESSEALQRSIQEEIEAVRAEVAQCLNDLRSETNRSVQAAIERIMEMQQHSWTVILFQTLISRSQHWPRLQRHPEQYGTLVDRLSEVRPDSIPILLTDRKLILELKPAMFEMLLTPTPDNVEYVILNQGTNVLALEMEQLPAGTASTGQTDPIPQMIPVTVAQSHIPAHASNNTHIDVSPSQVFPLHRPPLNAKREAAERKCLMLSEVLHQAKGLMEKDWTNVTYADLTHVLDALDAVADIAAFLAKESPALLERTLSDELKWRTTELEYMNQLMQAEERALQSAEMALRNWCLDMIEHRGETDKIQNLRSYNLSRRDAHERRAQTVRNFMQRELGSRRQISSHLREPIGLLPVEITINDRDLRSTLAPMREHVIDLLLGTGSRYLFHVDKKGMITAIRCDISDRYQQASAIDTASNELSGADLHFPYTVPVYAHAYKEVDMNRLLDAIAPGDVLRTMLVTDPKMRSSTIRKSSNGKLSFEAKRGGNDASTGNIEQVIGMPSRYLYPPATMRIPNEKKGFVS